MLSCARIALIPFFIWLMYEGSYIAAAVVLASSGVTDFLDGFLARRYNWISQAGKALDPTADKLTQVTVCVVLAYHLRRYWPFFAVLLFKEAVMLAFGGYLLTRGVKLEGARWFGKVVTGLFYVSMVVIILVPNMPTAAVYAMLGLTSCCALIAFILYIPEFLGYLRRDKTAD
jgi:cardiolipin synthase